MNKHIVKHIVKHTVKHTGHSYLGFGTFCGSLRGQYFIFGALYPSKSGLINKNAVKHIANEQTYRETYR